MREAKFGGKRLEARMAAVLCVLAVLEFALVVQAAPPSGSIADRMSTQERVSQPGWWPTKLLPTRKDFVGSEACTQCHASVATGVKDTEMSRALLRAEESKYCACMMAAAFKWIPTCTSWNTRPAATSFP